MENFCGALEKRESLAQRIFPHLRYAKCIYSNISSFYTYDKLHIYSNRTVIKWTILYNANCSRWKTFVD